MKFKKHKGISRIDQPEKHTHGWYVRVSFNGKSCSKFFSDDKNGGKRVAFDKALQFRDRSEKSLGKPRTDRMVVALSSRNQTGVIGVHKKVVREAVAGSKRKKIVRNVYEVTWSPEPNQISRTTISIDAHGEEKAFAMACRIRRKKEREIYGKSVS